MMNSIRVSNSLDPDHARHFVRPDLGPICLLKVLSRREIRLFIVANVHLYSTCARVKLNDCVVHTHFVTSSRSFNSLHDG